MIRSAHNVTLDEYQKKAMSTDYKPGDKSVTSMKFMAHVLGLVGESGEFADKIKKIYRNHDGEMSKEQREQLFKELGDVLWYVAALSDYLGSSMEEVAQMNIAKLADRAERNVIASEGDNR